MSLVIGFILITGYGCRKPERIPEVVTKPMSTMSYTEVSAVGEIVDLGEVGIEEHGFCWANSPDPELTDSFVKLGQANAIGTFNSTIKNLSPGSTYYLRAYAISEGVSYYGKSVGFSTEDYSLPTVTTTAVFNISDTSATVGGTITDDGGSTIPERGIYYGTSSSSETSGTKLQIGSGTGVFSTSLTGLTAGTIYYIKAYATNSVGIAYGDDVSFSTKDELNIIDLVSYYPFNGNANDESENRNNGIVYGPILTSDRFGNSESAYSFDGVDDYIRIPFASEFNLKIPMSIMAWVYPTSLSNTIDYNIVICQSRDSDEIYSLGVKEGTIMSGHTGISTHIPLNQWTFIAYSVSPDSIVYYYKNEQLVTSFKNNFPSSLINGTGTNDIYIGKDENHFEEKFKGKIDNIMVYNRFLNGNEIEKIYQLTK